jgi:hypothetical protein
LGVSVAPIRKWRALRIVQGYRHNNWRRIIWGDEHEHGESHGNGSLFGAKSPTTNGTNTLGTTSEYGNSKQYYLTLWFNDEPGTGSITSLLFGNTGTQPSLFGGGTAMSSNTGTGDSSLSVVREIPTPGIFWNKLERRYRYWRWAVYFGR